MIYFRRALIVVALLLAGCGGLAGEPAIVATLPPVTPSVSYPATPPDLAVGASVFAGHCTQCHGLSGAGDGALIGSGQGQIGVHPLSFRDAATTAAQTPLEFYNTITDGNIEHFMPPWKDALTDDQRWAVALYTYTLHNAQANVDAGAALTSGQPITLANLPSAENNVKLTDAQLISQVGLPAAFISSLSDQQKNDLAAYLRSLTVANAMHMGLVTSAPQVTAEPAVTPEVTAAPAAAGTGTISGQVTNGTSGAKVPADLKISLYVITTQGASAPMDATVGADGKFSFANIDIRLDQKYVVTTTYNGRAYGSEAKDGDPTTNKVDLPITIYETTDDVSVLTILAWVSQVQLVGNNLQVSDFIQIGNSADRAYSTNVAVDDKRYGGVEVPVPKDALIQSADVSNSRYTIGADGHSVIDTAPVLPGQSYIFQMVYSLPYRGDIQVEQTVPYTLSGAYRLLVNLPGATVTSDLLKSLGPQELSGVQYQSYGTSDPLKAKDSIRYGVQGGVQATSSTAAVINRDQLIPLLLIVAGLVVILTAGMIYWRGRRPLTPEPTTRSNDALVDGLIQQISELDETYNKGSLDEDIYQKRRERLKARLAALIDEDK
ncbi:MAG: cytochrome c [Anaerolineae bacterium]|nr:cytochrome c [Anaerolineae bacterium]